MQACKTAKVRTNLTNFSSGFVQTLVRKIKYISIREGSASRLVRMQK